MLLPQATCTTAPCSCFWHRDFNSLRTFSLSLFLFCIGLFTTVVCHKPLQDPLFSSLCRCIQPSSLSQTSPRTTVELSLQKRHKCHSNQTHNRDEHHWLFEYRTIPWGIQGEGAVSKAFKEDVPSRAGPDNFCEINEVRMHNTCMYTCNQIRSQYK
jgi:hypothetical protein